MNKAIIAIASAGLLASACASSDPYYGGGTNETVRQGAAGAAIGALAGAAIGNNLGSGNAARGAAIGAVVGGAVGAVRGSEADRRNRGLSRQYDSRSGQYYYCYPEGDCYWENGTRRN